MNKHSFATGLSLAFVIAVACFSFSGQPFVGAMAPVTAAHAAGRTCTGPVLHVIDGDTVWMRCHRRKIKVRLEYIDAPEVAHPRWHKSGQPGGIEARGALIALIGGERVTLHRTGKDDYGRTLGVLSRDGKNLNLALVQEGWAWAYTRYATRPYKVAQQAAKRARRGLWAFPVSQREAPWRFRHRH